MYRCKAVSRPFTAVLFLWMFFLIPVSASAATFAPLEKRLIGDGFSREHIKALYDRPETKFDARGVSLFFMHSEGKLNYGQFTSKKSIANAKKYMKTHAAALDAAEKKYGVDKTVITAIALVETRLGTYVGKRSILNTLSTIASLADSEAREELWNSIESKRRYTRVKFDAKADKKSAWAYTELKAFLKVAKRDKLDPVKVPGSYAGALGIAQFMPSNVLNLAKDGNNDGLVDLFNHTDAVTSIANYLKHHGWRPGLSREKAKKVLLRYNYSKYYVNTLLKISDILKKG